MNIAQTVKEMIELFSDFPLDAQVNPITMPAMDELDEKLKNQEYDSILLPTYIDEDDEIKHAFEVVEASGLTHLVLF